MPFLKRFEFCQTQFWLQIC